MPLSVASVASFSAGKALQGNAIADALRVGTPRPRGRKRFWDSIGRSQKDAVQTQNADADSSSSRQASFPDSEFSDYVIPYSDDLRSRGSSSATASDALRKGAYLRMVPMLKNGAKRIIPRNSHFHQATGHLNISRDTTFELRSLTFSDFFHLILSLSLPTMLLMVVVLYVTVIFVFATFYLWAVHGTNCARANMDFGVDFATLSRCYFFSLETMMTIGYGTEDPFFQGCEIAMGFIITVQALVGIILDMSMLGFIYARMSRGQKRASTVVFSETAVIRRDPMTGSYLFEFRVADVGDEQLIEARVRCYALFHGTDHSGMNFYFKPHYLRLDSCDEYYADVMLFLCFPRLLSHRIIDGQQVRRAKRKKRRSSKDSTMAVAAKTPRVTLRKALQAVPVPSPKGSGKLDAPPKVAASRSVDVPRPGHRQSNAEGAGRSMSFMAGFGGGGGGGGLAKVETVNDTDSDADADADKGGSHRSDDESDDDSSSDSSSSSNVRRSRRKRRLRRDMFSAGSPLLPPKFEITGELTEADEDEITTYWRAVQMEIVVLVEGTEPTTSSSIQARHSYVADDILWRARISDCVHRDEKNRCHINFDLFHAVEPDVDPHGYKSLKERHEATYGTDTDTGTRRGSTPTSRTRSNHRVASPTFTSSETVPHIPFLSQAPLSLNSRARRIASDTRPFVPGGGVPARRSTTNRTSVYVPPPPNGTGTGAGATSSRSTRPPPPVKRSVSRGSLFRGVGGGLRRQPSKLNIDTGGVFHMEDDIESVRLERTNSQHRLSDAGVGANSPTKPLLDKS